MDEAQQRGIQNIEQMLAMNALGRYQQDELQNDTIKIDRRVDVTTGSNGELIRNRSREYKTWRRMYRRIGDSMEWLTAWI